MTEEGWTRFKPGTITPLTVDGLMAEFSCTAEEARSVVDMENNREAVWINSLYQVNVYRVRALHQGTPDLLWLSIKRRDKTPVHDWRHFQRIKNEIVGPEFEGVELYPAESRLVDTANQYHLYVVDSKAFRFGFGFQSRAVREAGHDGKWKQRAVAP